MLNEEIIKVLRATARHRANAEERANEFRKTTDALILEGYAAGVPKQQLAEAAGLTRQTIYTVLRKAGVQVETL